MAHRERGGRVIRESHDCGRQNSALLAVKGEFAFGPLGRIWPHPIAVEPLARPAW